MGAVDASPRSGWTAGRAYLGSMVLPLEVGPMTVLSIGDFARRERVDLEDVLDWLSSGLPALEGPGGVLGIDVREARRWMAEHLDEDEDDEEDEGDYEEEDEEDFDEDEE